ncbi:MAG: hypothetical protein IPP17_30310 [Bacteroidetes bacterium]|nr:hypothetical protein [Bacteroidota bacterium]
MHHSLYFPTLVTDCRSIIGTFLSQYGIAEHGAPISWVALRYAVHDWILEVCMVAEFPRIAAPLGFLNPAGVEVRSDLLQKATGIERTIGDQMPENYVDRSYYQLSPLERYCVELKFLRAFLERCYLPILEGKFSYRDYLDFVTRQAEIDPSFSKPTQ